MALATLEARQRPDAASTNPPLDDAKLLCIPGT